MTFPVTIGEFVARYRWPTDLHAARPIYPGEIPGLNTARFFEEAMRIESMSPQDLFLKGYIRGCSAKWSTICGSGYFSSIDPINDPLARFCIEEGRRTLSEGDLARLKKLFTKSLKSKDHITLRGMEIGRNLLSADTSRCGEVFGIPRAAAGKERSSGKGSGTVALLDEAANFNAFFAPLYPRSEVRSVDISRSLQKQIAVTALAGAGVAGGIAPQPGCDGHVRAGIYF